MTPGQVEIDSLEEVVRLAKLGSLAELLMESHVARDETGMLAESLASCLRRVFHERDVGVPK